MNDYEWDKKLKINTSGRDDTHSDEYHYPYEPTPYSVLERLVESGYIEATDILVDYGCGKGRVGFFLNQKLGCSTIGIEYNEKIFRNLEENLNNYGKKRGVDVVCTSAETYIVEDATAFYFFNPFSVEILRSVIGQILESYYNRPRTMKLFFYYPEDEYVSYLMTEYELSFFDEIDCHDLFVGKNNRERILIFEVA